MTSTTIRLTPGQRFAEEYGSKAVEEMLSAITWAKRLALAITLLVMAASFQHQNHFLRERGTDFFGAIVIPLAIDLLTLLCIKVLSATGMARTAKAIALTFLLFPVIASSWINYQGSPNATVGTVYVIVVCFIAVAEVIKAFIAPDFGSILAEEARIQPAKKVGTKLTEEEKAQRNAKRQATIARKRAEAEREARRQRRRKAQVDVLERSYSLPSAPVSPAPGM